MWQKCNLFWVLAVIILFQSCQEIDLGINLPYEGDRLVLYADLSPDKIVTLRINKTYPPTGKFTVKSGMPGANVQLFENGIFKERLAYSDSGNYVAKSKPKVGFMYSFKAILMGFPDVETQPVTIPQNVSNPRVVLGKDSIVSINLGNMARKLTVEWTDFESNSNDFLVIIEGRYQGKHLGVGGYNIGKDGELEDGCSFSRTLQHYVFRDLCFPLQKFSTNFGVETRGFLQDRNLPPGAALQDADAYRVSIANISNSYFRFLQDELQPIDIFLAFQLPKSRFSNVKNGYGIIIASNETVFNLKAK